MSLIAKKSKDIMEVIILWENNWLFMKCGIINNGVMKLKNQRLLYKLLLLWDMKKIRNFM